MHCASSNRASVSESSDFSRSLRAGAGDGAEVGVGTGVGVGVDVPVHDGGGAAPACSIKQRKINITTAQ